MEIEKTIFSTASLLGVMREMEPVPNYWRQGYGRVFQSTEEEIDFGKMWNKRKIAPLVVPTAQGKPIYDAQERVYKVKPAYVKPKDAVDETRMIRRRAGIGELLNGNGRPLAPQARYNAVVADIVLQHREATERRWEWLAAQASLYGKVILEDDAYPRTLVDFERDAAHTVAKTVGNYWGDAGVSIQADIEAWRFRARRAKFGGPLSKMTVTARVWDVMRKDDSLREEMNLNYRPSQTNNVNLDFGIREGLDVEYVGTIAGNLQVYVYSDYYEDAQGNMIPFMRDGDVHLEGPNLMGVSAFGAIRDKKAQFQALPIFTKMYDEEDPAATIILSQSAPLMVPINPNATLLASVLPDE